jgi:hypothetical protein
MKRAYNQTYFPPIPVLQIRLHSLDSELSTALLEVIVDTGSDGTIVPLKHLRKIEARAEGFANLRSPWGRSKRVRTYRVDVEVEGVNFPGIWVVGDETGNEFVLGRDVLNRMRLLLDGLGSQIELVSY